MTPLYVYRMLEGEFSMEKIDEGLMKIRELELKINITNEQMVV